LTGALICSTLDSRANNRSEASQSSAISLQSKKNCRFTGGFQPRGFNKYDKTCKQHFQLSLIQAALENKVPSQQIVSISTIIFIYF
jgi:hypothetical protein